MGARAALTCRSGFAGAAQSRTAKPPHTKQPTPLTSLMFAPISLYLFHVFQSESRRFDSSAQLRKFGPLHGCSSESSRHPARNPVPYLLVPHHGVALGDSGPGRGVRSVSLTRRVKSQ